MRRPRSRPNSLANRAEGVRIARAIIERLMDNPEGREAREAMRRMTDPATFAAHADEGLKG